MMSTNSSCNLLELKDLILIVIFISVLKYLKRIEIMGRKGRKGFNWKARQNDQDPSTTQKSVGESKVSDIMGRNILTWVPRWVSKERASPVTIPDT